MTRTEAERRLLAWRKNGAANRKSLAAFGPLVIEAEGPRDEELGDAIHAAVHPGHPWSGCSNPDLVYVWIERFRAALKASES